MKKLNEQSAHGVLGQIKKKPKDFWGLKKSTWKKIAIVVISLYIGWSWAKISDQAQIIKLQQKVLAADSSTTVNPQ